MRPRPGQRRPRPAARPGATQGPRVARGTRGHSAAIGARGPVSSSVEEEESVRPRHARPAPARGEGRRVFLVGEGGQNFARAEAKRVSSGTRRARVRCAGRSSVRGSAAEWVQVGQDFPSRPRAGPSSCLLAFGRPTY